MLRQRQQAFFLGRYRDSLVAMRMHDAESVLAGGVNGAWNREAGRVDVVWSLHQDVSVQADLDQAGSGDFVEHHAVWINQKLVPGAGESGGDVSENEVVPAEEGNE